MGNKSKNIWLISIGLMFLLVFFGTGMITRVFADSMPDYVKVGLRYGNTAVNLAAIDTDQALEFGLIEGDIYQPLSDLQGNHAVTVEVKDGKIVINDLGGNTLETVEAGLTCCIMASDSEAGGILRFNNVPYRGGLLLQLNVDGKITVINRLHLENYLYGVLHQEMSQSNPIEALKAQAIAARNFTAGRMNAHISLGFDVCTATHCQVYKGYSGEYPSTNQAVDETAGLLMFSDAALVQAYYHKNSGGYTENSENVWFTVLPYLRGVLDPYSPPYLWTANLSSSSIQSLLLAGGYDTGTVQQVAIKGRSESGGVLGIEIKGDLSTILLERDKIRSILGFTTIKSLKFDLIDSNEAPLSLQSATTLEDAATEISILSADGSLSKSSLRDIYASNGSAPIRLSQGGTSNDNFVFSGTGYGHRLGMSQDGAIAMANQGLGYEEILKFYYTNIEIR